MREYLARQIRERRDRLAELDQERAGLIAELRAYEDAYSRSDGDEPLVTALLPLPQKRVRRKAQSSNLNLSPTWIAILDRLSGFERFRSRDVEIAARALHKEQDAIKEQSSVNVRVQLSLYTRRGLVNRLGGGNYKVSDYTKAELLLRKTAFEERNAK